MGLGGGLEQRVVLIVAGGSLVLNIVALMVAVVVVVVGVKRERDSRYGLVMYSLGPGVLGLLMGPV